jgi:hypothetical protein
LQFRNEDEGLRVNTSGKTIRIFAASWVTKGNSNGKEIRKISSDDKK